MNIKNKSIKELEEIAQNIRELINKTWKEIYYLSRYSDYYNKLDLILENHTIEYFKLNKTDNYSDFLLNKKFIPERIQNEDPEYFLSLKKIESYAMDLFQDIKSCISK